MINFASKSNKHIMRYRIKKETNPTRPTCGKYKAVAVHYHTVDSKQLIEEAAQRMGTHKSNVLAVLSTVAYTTLITDLRQKQKELARQIEPKYYVTIP
jgi:hypothetical protein